MLSDPRGCDVARKATWQSHADPCSAPTWRYIYIIIYIYINVLCPSLYGKGHTRIGSSGVINPTIPSLFFSVGLTHTLFTLQVTWTRAERRIEGAIKRRASIGWTNGPPDLIKDTCQIKLL